MVFINRIMLLISRIRDRQGSLDPKRIFSRFITKCPDLLGVRIQVSGMAGQRRQALAKWRKGEESGAENGSPKVAYH